MLRKPLALLSLLLTPSLCFAQSVLIVDDDGGVDVDSTTVMGAISAASDGDVILVRSGTYVELLTIDGKGLSIVAEEGAQVLFDGFNTFAQPALAIENLGASQVVYLHGLSIGGASTFSSEQIVLLRDNEGPIWIEQCTIVPGQTNLANDGIAAVDCDDVTITRCSITSTPAGADCTSVGNDSCGNGISVTRSSVYLFDSDVQAAGTAAVGIFSRFFGGSAVVVEDGELIVSGSTLTGGAGAFQSCGFMLNGGGGGLVLGDGSATAQILDTTIVGAAGADSMGVCGEGPMGPDTFTGVGTVATVLTGTARNFAASSPVVLGDDILLSYQGLPGDLVILGYNLGPAGPGVFVPGIKGAVLILGPGTPTFVVQGMTDAFGALTVTIPGGPAILSGAFDHFVGQPIFLDGSSPTVGDPSQMLVLLP